MALRDKNTYDSGGKRIKPVLFLPRGGLTLRHNSSQLEWNYIRDLGLPYIIDTPALFLLTQKSIFANKKRNACQSLYAPQIECLFQLNITKKTTSRCWNTKLEAILTTKQMILRAFISYAILESCKCSVITMISFFINVLFQQGQVQREHFPCASPFLSLYLPLSYSLLFKRRKALKCPLFPVLTFPDLSEHCRNTMFHYNRAKLLWSFQISQSPSII